VSERNQEKNGFGYFVEKIAIPLLLGFGAALFGSIFAGNLQRQTINADYQKEFFQKRVQAYTDILAKAQSANDAIAEAYCADLGWRTDLKAMENASVELSTGGRDGVVGSRPLNPYGDVALALKEVEGIKRTRNIYFSAVVNQAAERYLTVVWKDINSSFKQHTKILSSNRTANTGPHSINVDICLNSGQSNVDSNERARNAYNQLDAVIREVLKTDGIVLG
jgi:hypothetical protein